LVELLAVAVVLTFLSVLILPSLVSAKQKTLQATCQSNLKQIGCALQIYANANHDSLPGPASALVAADYDTASSNQLVWYLADPLGCERASGKAQIVRQLWCPARGSAAHNQKTTIRGTDYVLNDGRDGLAPPFGRPESPTLQPLKLFSIAAFKASSACAAMSDADKGNVNATLAGWTGLPYQPIHGHFRNQLYFDWHVAGKSW